MSNGQPAMQYPHPMQFSCWKSTSPLLYCTIAPGAGQAFRHPGSAQCMHWSLRISQCSPAPSSYSWNLIRFQKFHAVCGSRSFHSWQATSQALQPIHVLVSISLLTMAASRMPGDAVEVAETLLSSSVFPGMAPLPLHLLQLHEEALVFRCERVGVYDGRGHQIGHRAFLLPAAEEAPVDREADLIDCLAGHLHRLDAFGDHGLALDRAARRSHPDFLAVPDAFLARQLLRDFHEEFRLQLH